MKLALDRLHLRLPLRLPGWPPSRDAKGPSNAAARRGWQLPAWLGRLTGGARPGGGGSGTLTAFTLGERGVAVRVSAQPGARPRLEAVMAGDAAAPAQWRAARLFAHSQPVLVLRCAERQLLHVDHPEVPDDELTQAVRWPLAEALECDAEALLATAVPLPRINDAQRTQVLAVGARLEPVRAQIAQLAAAGIAVRAIDIIDSALRGMALLQGPGDDAARTGVMLAAVGSELCIGLVKGEDHGIRLCALRTLALPSGAPRDAAGFEEQLALHIQRTTDTFERQATQLAIRQVVALLPSIAAEHRDDVRAMLPLAARWFEPASIFDITPEAAAGLQQAEAAAMADEALALACVAAARLLEPAP